MSDRLAVFNNGRIEQVGSPAEVYERPATQFVAGFVGHVEPAHAATSAQADRRARPARSRSGPRRSASAEPDDAVGADEIGAPGRIREVVYLGPGHALHRRRSTRAPSSS